MHPQAHLAEQPQETVALGDFKADVSDVLRRLRENGQALVVTENGEAAMVLVTPDEFQALRYHDRFVEAVLTGLEDVHAGRTINDEDLGRELDAEFGPLP